MRHPRPLWRRFLLAAAWMAALLPASRAQSPAPAAAPPGTPPPVSAFFARPDMDSPLLSPSGRFVAVLVPGGDNRNALAVVDLEGSTPPRAVAHFSDVDIGRVWWVGDDWLVFDVVDLQVGSGERRIAPGLFSIARSGERLRQLVKLRGRGFIVAPEPGVDRRLEYNHRMLGVPQGSQREIVIAELDLDSQGHITGERPFLLNVESGRVRWIEMGQGVPESVLDWVLDAAGQPRVAVTRKDGRTRVHVRENPGENQSEKQPEKLAEKERDRWRLLLDADSLEMPWWPQAVDADGHLYVTAPMGAGGTRVLARLDLATGKPLEPPLVKVPGFDFHGRVVAEHAGGRTLGVRALTDGEMTVWIDPAMKALQEQVDARLPGRVNRLSCRRCGQPGSVLLVESWSDRDPGTYLLWNGGKPSIIGRRLRGIDSRQMATMALERIKARDGRELPVWITQPQRAEGAPPPPAVVLVHGGPWVRGTHWAWHELPQFLASRGYAVIEPEFRGSAGYGDEHFHAGLRQWGQAMQDDVTDALRWAAAQGLADGRRACIAGGSYGGYAALMGLVRDPELYRCGIAWAAVSDPLRVVQGSFWWNDDMSDEVRRYSLPVLIGDPKADAAMFKAISPVQQAARIRAPVLLVHGEEDRRVPLVHAREMRDALRQAGREPEWLTFPGEGHGWQRLETERAFAQRLEAFLARHLRN